MKVNAAFHQRVLIDSRSLAWNASPQPGVERRMLDRVGEEVARATSIVRFAPGHGFAWHRHGLGEELLILEGGFQDELGDYPEGTYLRNPPGSEHSPRTDTGCIMFVKLRQFNRRDHVRVMCNWLDANPQLQTERPMSVGLYAGFGEHVSVDFWPAGSSSTLGSPFGTELLVIEGSCRVDERQLHQGCWLRLPPRDAAMLVAGVAGVTVWQKQNALKDVFARKRLGLWR